MYVCTSKQAAYRASDLCALHNEIDIMKSNISGKNIIK